MGYLRDSCGLVISGQRSTNEEGMINELWSKLLKRQNKWSCCPLCKPHCMSPERKDQATNIWAPTWCQNVILECSFSFSLFLYSPLPPSTSLFCPFPLKWKFLSTSHPKTRLSCVAQAGSELKPSCLSLLSAGIIYRCDLTQLKTALFFFCFSAF